MNRNPADRHMLANIPPAQHQRTVAVDLGGDT
jgi:hypothetical protein